MQDASEGGKASIVMHCRETCQDAAPDSMERIESTRVSIDRRMMAFS
jgi:hypothetical protein